MKQIKWKWLGLVLMAVAILYLCSCGGAEVDYPPLGTVVLSNNSDATIDGFYMVPVYQTTWGKNLLADLLHPGESTRFVNIVPDDYDVMIRSTGQYSEYFAYAYDFYVDEGDLIVLNVKNSSFSGSLEIRNNTSSAYITGVYVVPTDATTWGKNQTSKDIEPSGVLHLYDLDPGLYDVKIVWRVGADSFYYDVDVESLALTSLNVD